MEFLHGWFDNHTDKFKYNGTLSNVCHIQLYGTAITTSDLLGVLVGQPVIARLLWVAFHAKKTDVLNINLAIFHNLQYLLSLIDIYLLFTNILQHLRIVSFLFVYVLIGGPMNLTFICLERYFAVVHPTSYPLLKRYRVREVCALSVWLLAFPFALMKALSNEFHLWEPADAAVNTLLSLFVIILVWSNVAILKALRTSGPATDKLHPAKKRAYQTIRTISIITLLCYVPVSALARYKSVKGYGSTCVIVPVSIAIVTVASVVHPVFYLATTGNLFPCQRTTQ